MAARSSGQRRHPTLLATSVGAAEDDRPSFVPGFAATLRILLLVRVASALYSGISDCDETYNYWEPLHLLTHPPGPGSPWQSPFQTWEYAPEYAIRSWAYVAQYLPIAGWLPRLLGKDKAASFYATRMLLAFTSSCCEASLVQSTAKVINEHVALLLLALLFSAGGMYESATALLPSTFVMYTTTLAFSFALSPSRSCNEAFPTNASLPSTGTRHRTLLATAIFALGALLAWPFALVLAGPFVIEGLFMPSGLLVPQRRRLELIGRRGMAWARSVLLSACLALPIVLIDTLAYGRFAIVPLNIIVYNILSARRGAGPTLYGIEPWYYYILNLTLNFGPTFYLAIASLPLAIAHAMMTKRADLSQDSKGHDKAALQSSGQTTLLSMRLLPVYVWLILLSVQPHKEERFVFAAYPLICFNAAVALHCMQNVLARIVTKVTGTQVGARVHHVAAIAVLGTTATFSLLRVAQIRASYHAPFTVLEELAHYESPRLRNTNTTARLCYGKEWHRFPSSYLVPSGITVDFIKSDFRGILPKHFAVPVDATEKTVDDGYVPQSAFPLVDAYLARLWPWRATTRAVRTGFNDLNREEPDRYVDIEQCDYLVDVDFAHSYTKEKKMAGLTSGSREPRFVRDEAHWTQVKCVAFLDAGASRAAPGAALVAKARAEIERILWLPAILRAGTNRYGDYCLLRAKKR